jgi:hypothetical protein
MAQVLPVVRGKVHGDREELQTMMTHEQIKDTIVRLRELGDIGRITSFDIVDAVYDSGNNYKVRDTLIAILEQADPDTHIELPTDADGLPIHVGDVMCAAYDAHGAAIPKSGCERQKRQTVRGIAYGRDGLDEWGWQDKTGIWHNGKWWRHYHKPTVKEILRDFISESEDAVRKGYDGIPDEIYEEYDQRLREAVRHED